MADFILDAFRTGTKSDIAMKVSSGVRDKLFKGEISFGDVYRVLPYDYTAVSLDLTGEQVKRLMENSAQQNKNYMQVSGMTLDIDYTRPPGSQVSNIRINDEPMDMKKTYRVVVDEISSTGSCGYDEFLQGKNIQYHKSQRDLVLDYVQYADYTKAEPHKIVPLNFPPMNGRIAMHDRPDTNP